MEMVKHLFIIVYMLIVITTHICEAHTIQVDNRIRFVVGLGLRRENDKETSSTANRKKKEVDIWDNPNCSDNSPYECRQGAYITDGYCSNCLEENEEHDGLISCECIGLRVSYKGACKALAYQHQAKTLICNPCWTNNCPQGSYLDSCSSCEYNPVNENLSCKCRRRDGKYIESSVTKCPMLQFIMNNDGKLQCD